MKDIFLRACFGKPVERTPVWMMRQAGRYMAEYRELRSQYDFWTMCRTPELATKVTLQPIERFDMDAAILFSDILIGLPAMGVDVTFNPGPQVGNPVRTLDDIAGLKRPNPKRDLGFVLEAVTAVREKLDGRVPLIGFCGAPMTLAAYMIEGGASKHFLHLKTLLYEEPKAAHGLMDVLVDAQADYLVAQIEAGAQAIQIFDTWAGNLSRDLYRRFLLEPLTRLIEKVRRPSVPIIYFIKDSAHVLDMLPSIGADVLSIDDKMPIGNAFAVVGDRVALQGNMDPALLLGSLKGIRVGVEKILDDVPQTCGHIFNLGHGVLPMTPVENVEYLVGTVKQLSTKNAG